ncbi:MAG: glycosyltransferase family 4 protein [Bacteroidia bacterium]|nr:glycosyltransferase family 4 protein [Bacteroidia bacterium]
MNKINIIIPALGGKEWTGGMTYQENLVGALKLRNDVCIYILNNLDKGRDNPESKGIRARLLRIVKQVYSSLYYQLSRIILGYDYRLSKKLQQFSNARINVLFTHNFSFLDIRNHIIKFYWIPDFQHVHLPHLFTPEQLEERNHKFLIGCQKADVIILSSKDAQNDLANFAPEFLEKSHISNFVANVNENIWAKDPSYLMEKYFIPSKFFFLPNQFWKHKNHIVVFKALYHLKEKGILPIVMCTGNPSEFRSPGYYKELMEKIKEWGIGDQIRLLGLVPHDDVLMLIRQSLAVINPSLFEGWSTTVEECKSIGKKTLLSDIPVHREQSPASVEYFPPHDHESLANLLRENWEKLSPGPDIALEGSSRVALLKRKEEYANNFINIVKNYQKSLYKSKPSLFKTPILFLIFNRPQHTFAVFEILRKIRPAKLFIAADGPRSNVPEDHDRCEEARKIIHMIDWECDLQVLFRETNLSLKHGVSSAINWFFENVEEGIILEDDCLADESFFSFCEELLERYRNDERIMHINGSNFLLGKEFNFTGSYYFSKICHPWGWATWKRSWQKYDIDMKNLDTFLTTDKLAKITSNKEAAEFYANSFRNTAAGKINTWDYQWFYTVWLHDGIAISPARNLVSNIGFGKEATHTNYKYTRLSKMKRNNLDRLRHSDKVIVNTQADEYTLQVNVNEGKGNFIERLVVKIKITLGIHSK